MSGAEGTRSPVDAWSAMPLELMEAMDPDGDFFKKHLLNPAVFRMLGDVAGRRVLDAGAGQGYLSRLLAARGAVVTAVEPAEGLHRYGARKEAELGQGVRWVQADLTDLRLEPAFDAAVANMVFLSIPDWTSALRTCVQALRPGGQLVFSVNHPCFDPPPDPRTDLGSRGYLDEYDMARPVAPDTHRPLSTYLNAAIAAGCDIAEVDEPGLSPALAVDAPPEVRPLVHTPAFLVVHAVRRSQRGSTR